jgi:hypothetical protein
MALAQSPRGELTLGWGNCRVSGGGAALATFACNTNSGQGPLMVAAFHVGPQGNLVAVNAADAQVDIYTQSLALDAWWQFSDPGTGQAGCRPLSSNFGPDLANLAGAACDRTYWPDVSNPPSGGASYAWPAGQSNHGMLRVIVAVDNTVAPTIPQAQPGEEMHLFSARLGRGQTTGPTACAGCLTAACLTLRHATIFQSNDDNIDLVHAPGQTSDQVMWQLTDGCAGDPTPNRNQTWGAIKSIYR